MQRYTCQLRDATYAWVLQEPIAELLDPATSAHVGKHSKGPLWTWADNSSVTGTVVLQQPSSDASANIPWLLLKTSSNGPAGAFSHITYVRRSETKGGVAPPASCTESARGAQLDVPYQATYTFYTTKE